MDKHTYLGTSKHDVVGLGGPECPKIIEHHHLKGFRENLGKAAGCLALSWYRLRDRLQGLHNWDCREMRLIDLSNLLRACHDFQSCLAFFGYTYFLFKTTMTMKMTMTKTSL